jgi:hypothetical protein
MNTCAGLFEQAACTAVSRCGKTVGEEVLVEIMDPSLRRDYAHLFGLTAEIKDLEAEDDASGHDRDYHERMRDAYSTRSDLFAVG